MMASIFKTPEGERRFKEAYYRLLSTWSVSYETTDVLTCYGTTHVIVSGDPDSPPLVLLHGMTVNSSVWRDIMASLSSRFRTYAIDMPGDFGMSVVAKPMQSAADCVLWLHEVLDGLELPRTHLLGHSMGGWTALNYALAAPERVDQLVLMAPIGSIMPVPLRQMMFRIYPALLFPKPKRIRRAWSWFLAKGNSLDDIVMDQIIESYTHCRLLMRVVPGKFTEEQMRGLVPPTLFMVGEEEAIYSAKEAVNRMKQWVPSVEAVVIPRAGHCLQAEQPSLVSQHIMQFLHSSYKQRHKV